MRKMILTATLLSAMASPAFATAKLTCSLDDATMKLSIESGVSTNGERLFDFRGAFVLKEVAMPDVLRTSRLDRTNLMQGWLDGNEVRLRIYAEAGSGKRSASADLVILTKASEGKPNRYDGTYALTVDRAAAQNDVAPAAITANGKVRCSVG